MTSENSLSNGHFGIGHFGQNGHFENNGYFGNDSLSIFPNIFLSFLKTFVCPRPEKFLQTIGAPLIIHKKLLRFK